MMCLFESVFKVAKVTEDVPNALSNLKSSLKNDEILGWKMT